MILLLSFAFLSGLVTILAPCIWPLLPIVLSSSVARSGKSRPLGITFGIMLSFTIFTLTLSTLVRLFHFDPNIFRLIAVFIISILGVSMIIPSFSSVIEVLVSRLTSFFPQANASPKSGFTSGFVTGLSLGVVWSPCAGPILASIATLSATGQVNSAVILVTIAYVVGVGIPLFIFAYAGQQLLVKTKSLSPHLGRIQQIFGIIMILTAVAIYTNYDKVIQSKLLDIFPSFSTSLTSFETNPQVKKQLDVLKGQKELSQTTISNPAPDFSGITHWLNTDAPLTIGDLKGKVVLVDFWTYTCINCIRTLPHVTAWYNKYHDQGFVVVGVHTPEFEFEKDTNNVASAIKQYGIRYPVAQDNDYSVWNSYHNEYWPAEYLIDAKGNIRHTSFGEGDYPQTESLIQLLLKEAGQNVTSNIESMPDLTPKVRLSPETYIGASRMQYYYPGGTIPAGPQNFVLTNPANDSFSLGGSWNIQDEYSITGANASLAYKFYADKVYLVLRPPMGKSGTVTVYLDDQKNNTQIISSDRLYTLVDLGGHSGRHLLRLEFSPGIQVFAFTFG